MPSGDEAALCANALGVLDAAANRGDRPLGEFAAIALARLEDRSVPVVMTRSQSPPSRRSSTSVPRSNRRSAGASVKIIATIAAGAKSAADTGNTIPAILAQVVTIASARKRTAARTNKHPRLLGGRRRCLIALRPCLPAPPPPPARS